ncbi:hypothetical protein IscW_ISCW009126 [Ixodes scapularis]|uniref:Uncharacterized protein n=1 Tax=Ixodes scapularis TaxID=6945 RepID=B7Q039_IXOSC|nr:hypothetical protein IscW_ISCW009126 [Ixodes scapularis]|eukprot:XP_002406810.1 hypothetical protein IscW_ISCW009126 [Ixodes scapularis]
MPPKQAASVPQDNNVSDDNSRDTSKFIRALQQYTARVEQVVATERETANQQFPRLLQENQRIAAESQASMADALAAAVGQALANNVTPGGPLPQSTPQFQPPPVAAFGGLRLQPGADAQPAVATSATDPWALASQLEFQPSAATQTAATAPAEPQVSAPYAAAANPGRFITAPDVAYNPYTVFTPKVAGRQRVFTVSDPPAKRDIAEAFIHEQQVSRHSQHIGRHEIAELQLLECFVQLWDCRSIGLQPGTSYASSIASDSCTTSLSPGGEPPLRATPILPHRFSSGHLSPHTVQPPPERCPRTAPPAPLEESAPALATSDPQVTKEDKEVSPRQSRRPDHRVFPTGLLSRNFPQTSRLRLATLALIQDLLPRRTSWLRQYVRLAFPPSRPLLRLPRDFLPVSVLPGPLPPPWMLLRTPKTMERTPRSRRPRVLSPTKAWTRTLMVGRTASRMLPSESFVG